MSWTLGSEIHAGTVRANAYFVDGNATSLQAQLNDLQTRVSTQPSSLPCIAELDFQYTAPDLIGTSNRMKTVTISDATMNKRGMCTISLEWSCIKLQGGSPYGAGRNVARFGYIPNESPDENVTDPNDFITVWNLGDTAENDFDFELDEVTSGLGTFSFGIFSINDTGAPVDFTVRMLVMVTNGSVTIS